MKTKAQILNITDFPYIEYDDNGNIIYEELSNKAWAKYKFNKDNLLTYQEYSSGSIKKFNEWGKIIFAIYPNGQWYKTKYNDHGNITYYKNSEGEWYKKEFDYLGDIIYYESHEGNYWNKTLMPDVPFPY